MTFQTNQKEAKIKEYGLILDKAKKEVNKILFDSRKESYKVE